MSTPAFHLGAGFKSIGYVERKLETALAHDLLRPYFPAHQEKFILLAFDTYDRLIRMEEVSAISPGRCLIPWQCWRRILGPDVTSVLMAHNHPSGISWPSSMDRQSTARAAMILDVLGIALIDHLIFVTDGHYSFRSAGLL